MGTSHLLLSPLSLQPYEPARPWGFALNVGNSVTEVGFPPGQGCFCAQLWWDHCWKSGTLSLSLSPPPGVLAGRRVVAPWLLLVPIKLNFAMGLLVQPPLMVWREKGWTQLPASLSAPWPPYPKLRGLTPAPFLVRSQAIFSSIPSGNRARVTITPLSLPTPLRTLEPRRRPHSEHPPAPGFAPVTQTLPWTSPLIRHQSIHPGFPAKRTLVGLARPCHMSLVAIGSKLLAADQPDKKWEMG